MNDCFGNVVPKDPRTLLQTPTKISIIFEIASNQSYWHQGLEYCIKTYCKPIAFKNFAKISLNINIDGIPTFKNSKDEFWPILFYIHECPQLKPMVIGIYLGKSKPWNVKLFLKTCMEECNNLLRHGIELSDGSLLNIQISCFITDSPARAFIKGW